MEESIDAPWMDKRNFPQYFRWKIVEGGHVTCHMPRFSATLYVNVNTLNGGDGRLEEISCT